MPKVYFAHTCLDLSDLGNTQEVEVAAGTVGAILDQLNKTYPGLKPRLVDSGGTLRVLSSALLAKNVTVADGYLFADKKKTKLIKSLDEPIGESENLLLSIFDIEFIEGLLQQGLIPSATERFTYLNEDGHSGRPQPYRGYVVADYQLEREPVHAFINSPIEIQQLQFDLADEMHFVFKADDRTLERFVRQECRLIPAPLVEAVYGLLTDPEEEESPQVRLRLFQEDVLFFMLGKLWQPESIPERALLLSMPTGGGKTEAFVFPLISHLLARKVEVMKLGQSVPHSVKALILYPTKALANDQAKRLAEIVQKVNEAIVTQIGLDELAITIGIFTGDTVTSQNGLQDSMGNFLSLFQVCPVCDQSTFQLDSQTVNQQEVTVQRCKSCGHRMNYTRVTRRDIFNAPPDILITNPDSLNYHIQVPNRQAVLLNQVELIVFDEVHEYNGIFGCNVAHLLRRMEALREGRPPFYVGLSATIGNARHLAALLFNVPLDEVLYIRHTEQRPYLAAEEVARWRSHLLLTPNMYVKKYAAYPLTATLNLVSALGHAIRDPHFRKILIFTNFKSDHDKLSFQILENERDYVAFYREELRSRVQETYARNDEPILNSAERSVMRQVARWYEWEEANLTLHGPNLTIGWHRGALEMEKRLRAVNAFASLNKIYTGAPGRGYDYPTDVMVATKTLELGVDIGNVSVVINSSAPFSNNAYIQRIGRGGRRKDSLAITVINPNNAIDAYMREHFPEYVFPDTFEDAPIIASNELIMRAHIGARVLDYLAKVKKEGWQLIVSDWLKHELIDSHQKVTPQQPERYAQALFEQIFPADTFESFKRWFEIETMVLNDEHAEDDSIEPYSLSREWVVGVLRDLCQTLKEQTSAEAKDGWDHNAPLVGFDSVFAGLTPSLRGAGQSVGLYLKKSKGEDEWKESISRQRTIYLNPPGSYQSQGRNLFLIERIKREDQDAEEELIDLLLDNSEAYDYFLRHFPESSLKARRAHRWRLNTPHDLLVRHFPGRYHCSNPKCGLTYTAGEVTDDLRCLECKWTLHQVTRVYRCPQCQHITEPPVPKLCINSDCVRHKLDKDQKGNPNPKWNLRIAVKKAIKDRNPAPLQGFFRFKSRPNLEWQCMDCQTIISFHARHVAQRLGTPVSLPDNRSLDGPNAHQVIAWYGLYRPEVPLFKKQTYQNLGYNFNGYNCLNDNCPTHWKGGLRAVNHPRFQTDVVQFHLAQKSLGRSRTTRLGEIYFFRGDVISIAERYALSDPKEDENTTSDVTRHRIFEEGELYATHFSPHMFGLKIPDLDDFLKRMSCATTSCAECKEILSIELGELYRPRMMLSPRFIEDEKPVQPDPRAVWCEVNRAGNCPYLTCQGCEHFEWDALRRFAVLHTLLHGILWALPKYTGLDVGSFKGVVNPGFLSNVKGVPNDLDLLIIDTNDGGSGAVHLVNRWWESHIEPMALEILQLAALPSNDPRRANLNLPYTCQWFNGNLCPVLTGKFVAEL